MKKFLSLLFISLIQISAWAEVNISSLFSDGAVLQQKAAIPVWGLSAEGTSVSAGSANLYNKAGLSASKFRTKE